VLGLVLLWVFVSFGILGDEVVVMVVRCRFEKWEWNLQDVVVVTFDEGVGLPKVDVTETSPVKIPQSAPKMAGSRLKSPVGSGRGENIVEVPFTTTLLGAGGGVGAMRQSFASQRKSNGGGPASRSQFTCGGVHTYPGAQPQSASNPFA
jgi:hypothetical protein